MIDDIIDEDLEIMRVWRQAPYGDRGSNPILNLLTLPLELSPKPDMLALVS